MFDFSIVITHLSTITIFFALVCVYFQHLFAKTCVTQSTFYETSIPLKITHIFMGSFSFQVHTNDYVEKRRRKVPHEEQTSSNSAKRNGHCTCIHITISLKSNYLDGVNGTLAIENLMHEFIIYLQCVGLKKILHKLQHQFVSQSFRNSF